MFVQPSVARRSLHVQVVIQCLAWSSANYVRVCPQNRKLISFATLPRMTPAPSSLRVTLERMATAHMVRFFTTRTPAAESLNTCLFLAVQTAGAHLIHDHLTRIALTASANALAPSSPIWFPSRKSVVIDWLAMSCFDVHTPYLNLVSHGDQMTAPRKRAILHTQMSVSPHTLLRQWWTKSHEVGA